MLTTDAVRFFLTSRKAKGLSSETLRWYRDILYSYVGRFRELPQDPTDIEEFLSECTAGDERRHGYFRALRAMYRFLSRRHGIDNPLIKLDPPHRSKKSPRALTPDELDQLFAFPHKPHIRAALLFLADTGCRIGELARLELTDLDETPWGHIAKVRGKTGERIVPISPEVYHAMLANLPLGYTVYRLRRLIALAFKDAHVPGTAHTLRHTFATLFNGDETALQRIMGHAHISTTMLYRHLRTQYLSEQHRANTPLRYVLNRTKSML